MSEITARLEDLLRTGKETALLRFSLGNAYIRTDPAKAASHLERAVQIDPAYSAAWKLLGRALTADHRPAEARRAYERGIAAAEQNRDIQAAREMHVFLKRLTDQGTAD